MYLFSCLVEMIMCAMENDKILINWIENYY